MGQHDIGDYLKKRVKDYNKEIDTNEIWANLDLENEKKKRGAWWLWPLGLLGVLIFVSGIYYSNSSAGTPQQNSVEAAKEIINSAENKNTEQKNKDKIKPNTTINKLQSETQKTSTTQTQLEATNSAHTRINTQSNAFENKILSKESFLNTQMVLDTNPSITQALSTFRINRETPSSSVATSINATSNLVNKLKPKITFWLTSSIPTEVPKTLYKIERTLPSIDDRFSLQEAGLIYKPKGRLSLDIYTGGFFINRSLVNNPFIEPIFRNKLSEKPLEMIALGSQIHYQWENNFYVGLGIEFQSINERYQHKQSSITDTVLTENTPIILQVSANRDTSVYQTGPALSAVQLDEVFTFYNSHRLLTIPLSIGYVIHKNNWSYSLEGTLLSSFYNQYSGTTIELDGTLTSQPSYLSTSVKIGYRAAISIERRLNAKLALYLKPSYQLYGSSFGNGYSQTYSFAGGLLGLKYVWH